MILCKNLIWRTLVKLSRWRKRKTPFSRSSLPHNVLWIQTKVRASTSYYWIFHPKQSSFATPFSAYDIISLPHRVARIKQSRCIFVLPMNILSRKGTSVTQHPIHHLRFPTPSSLLSKRYFAICIISLETSHLASSNCSSLQEGYRTKQLRQRRTFIERQCQTRKLNTRTFHPMPRSYPLTTSSNFASPLMQGS